MPSPIKKISQSDFPTNLEVFAGDGDLPPQRQLGVPRRVDLPVPLEPSEVVDAFAAHRHERHEGQRAPVGVDEADAEERDELAAGHQQKEHVHEVAELIEEDLEREAFCSIRLPQASTRWV